MQPALLMESIGQQPQDLMTYREFVMEMESLLQWEREEMFVIQMTGPAASTCFARFRATFLFNSSGTMPHCKGTLCSV